VKVSLAIQLLSFGVVPIVVYSDSLSSS